MLSQQLTELATIIKGNPTLGVTPLSERLGHLEAKFDALDKLVGIPVQITQISSRIDEINRSREKEAAILRGIAIGLGINGAGVIGLLIKVLGIWGN
jgi:hypothetical protein